MHIPDGFLDPRVYLLFYGLTALFVAFSVRRVNAVLRDRHVPLLAVLTAAVFAAQMINWPVGPGGTTAHFVGCGLLGVFLGPCGGIVSMAVLLAIQCFFFGDGGVTALGANVWNMGVVGCIVGHYLYRVVVRAVGDAPRARIGGAFVGGWIGITAAAFFCGLQIGVSSQFPYGLLISVPVMTGYHFLLGAIEGAVTAGVVAYTLNTRPDLLELSKTGLR